MANDTKIDKNFISIKKASAVFCPSIMDGELVPAEVRDDNVEAALTINAEFMRLGYIMSEDLMNAVRRLDAGEAKAFFDSTVSVLKRLKGADVKYVPMYRNFPDEVMAKSSWELFMNAITHYWSAGTWMPESEDPPEDVCFEAATFKTLDLCTRETFDSIFTKLLASNASISEQDKKIVLWFLDNVDKPVYPKEIPFKENLCMVAGELQKRNFPVAQIAKTATDVLRIITQISGGDISLAENTKFKSLPRRLRKQFCVALEKVGTEEDFARHRNKWIKAFHSLHVGDYKSVAPKTFEAANKLRNNKRIETFNSKVEEALICEDIDTLTVLLESRPGDFARRLDHVLRISSDKEAKKVVESFSAIASKVATRVLMQVYAHFDSRQNDVSERVAFPKGSISKAVILSPLQKINQSSVDGIKAAIDTALNTKFSEKSSLGKVWIDPKLENAPIPMQQRSASAGLVSVARGTRMPLRADKDTIRLFIYWVGQDLDLSASFHDEDFNLVNNVSYTNLKSGYACHSGDITRAPNGAAEFIDINIPKALEAYSNARYMRSGKNSDKPSIRYVVMNVFIFSAPYNKPNFKDHDKVYAGWMMKDKPSSSQKFDPKLVEQRIDVDSDCKNVVPLVFDLWEREAIWVDLAMRRGSWGRGSYYAGNNVQNNKAGIERTLRAIVRNKKPSLRKLFEMHAFSRGEIVNDKDQADTIFSFDEGTTPFDIDDINSEFLE